MDVQLLRGPSPLASLEHHVAEFYGASFAIQQMVPLDVHDSGTLWPLASCSGLKKWDLAIV